MFPSTAAMLSTSELYFPFNKLAEQELCGQECPVRWQQTSGWLTHPAQLDPCPQVHIWRADTQQLQGTLPGSCQHPLSLAALLCPPITSLQPLPTLRVPQQLQLLHQHPEFQGCLSCWCGCPQLKHPRLVQMCLMHQGGETAFQEISNLAELCSSGMNSQGWIFGKFFSFVNSVSEWVWSETPACFDLNSC